MAEGTGGGGDAGEGDPGWFAVRCVFRWPDQQTYEERLTLWAADSLDGAIELAEGEAQAYADALHAEYLEIAQAYWIGPDRPDQGGELFSLMRDSELEPDDYLDSFFDTGRERQRTVD
jgi:hypothetical protein